VASNQDYDNEGGYETDVETTDATPYGPGVPSGSTLGSGVDPVFQRDKFLLKQKLMTISQKYDVCDENGNKILFIQRPAHALRNMAALFAAILTFFVVCGLFGGLAGLVAGGRGNEALFAIIFVFGVVVAICATVVVAVILSPKRHVTFFRDENMTESLLYVLQDKKLAFINMTYSIMEPDGTAVAVLHKNYLYDIFRKKWLCKDDQGREICVIREDSMLKAFFRRFFAGSIIGAMLRTNFIITDPATGTVLGTFNRKFTLRDRYVLDMSPDRPLGGVPSRIDRRIALAIGVMLDTGERR